MEDVEIECVAKLNRDLRIAAATLTPDEVRYLVDSYYQMQDDRKRSNNQVRALSESKEPCGVVGWLATNTGFLERQIAAALQIWADNDPLSRWAQSNFGIGPIIASGLRAHIDMTRVQTAGDVWRFAGLDPTSVWKKGQKRPWNASLKTLCWKIGESFVKVSGKEDAVYGKWYVAKKAELVTQNEAGKFADAAKAVIEKKPTHAQKAVYATGKLPDGHVHARAKRWVVKLFLAHYVEMGLKLAGRPVPLPYPIQHLGHAHKIEPPNAECVA